MYSKLWRCIYRNPFHFLVMQSVLSNKKKVMQSVTRKRAHFKTSNKRCFHFETEINNTKAFHFWLGNFHVIALSLSLWCNPSLASLKLVTSNAIRQFQSLDFNGKNISTIFSSSSLLQAECESIGKSISSIFLFFFVWIFRWLIDACYSINHLYEHTVAFRFLTSSIWFLHRSVYCVLIQFNVVLFVLPWTIIPSLSSLEFSALLANFMLGFRPHKSITVQYCTCFLFYFIFAFFIDEFSKCFGYLTCINLLLDLER